MMHISRCLIVYITILLGIARFGAGAMAVQEPAVLKYEEYVVEHEISATQAKNVALAIDPKQMAPPPGCQHCTSDERHYCLSGNFIHDHCCCDRRHHEYLNFIPHTCYVGTTLCRPIAADCAEYTRLRMCCCNKLVLQKWTGKASASSVSVRCENIIVLLIFLYVVNIYL